MRDHKICGFTFLAKIFLKLGCFRSGPKKVTQKADKTRPFKNEHCKARTIGKSPICSTLQVNFATPTNIYKKKAIDYLLEELLGFVKSLLCTLLMWYVFFINIYFKMCFR
jgi:hypothetical protein